MVSKEKIMEAFMNERYSALQILVLWTYEELEELIERYEKDYKLTKSDYVYDRIQALKYAIVVKRGNDEQLIDALT